MRPPHETPTSNHHSQRSPQDLLKRLSPRRGTRSTPASRSTGTTQLRSEWIYPRRIPAIPAITRGSLNERSNNLTLTRSERVLNPHQRLDQTAQIIEQDLQGVTPQLQRAAQRLHVRTIHTRNQASNLIAQGRNRLNKRVTRILNTRSRLNQRPWNKANIPTHEHNLQIDQTHVKRSGGSLNEWSCSR